MSIELKKLRYVSILIKNYLFIYIVRTYDKNLQERKISGLQIYILETFCQSNYIN